MEKDIQKQKPWTVSQIENEKPNAPRTKSVLSGYIGGSMNGGHNKVIAWKKVMAGEKHYQYNLKLNMQLLTPLTPAYQQLKCTIRTYFVPNSRVWENAEKYTAQKGGAAEIKITQIPNLQGKIIPPIQDTNEEYYSLTNQDIWRDAFISSYIPRVGENINQETDINKANIIMPRINALPLRGRIAIYNDYERNKEYDAPLQEYNSDQVSQEEWESYLPLRATQKAQLNMRAKREDNYYTNYRTEYQGFESIDPITDDAMVDSQSLIQWANWESKIAEARSQAENAQKNDWEIIAEIRGSKLLTEGKVQLIGKKTFNVNYSAITQNAYNTNSEIQPEFQVMGKQGAYSYTEVNIPLYAGMEFNEEGFVHIIATVSADSVFESGIDRNLLNVTPLDEYRPDLEGEKFDLMYEIENGTKYSNNLSNEEYRAIGYKRKFSEYFKLPNVVQADMTSNKIQLTKIIGDTNLQQEQVLKAENETFLTNNTYQFFEEDRYDFEEEKTNGGETRKKIWKDYTDILINKNQAIKNEIEIVEPDVSGNGEITIKRQNQIFFMGVCTLIADLPINEEIKNNYTVWGEH